MTQAIHRSESGGAPPKTKDDAVRLLRDTAANRDAFSGLDWALVNRLAFGNDADANWRLISELLGMQDGPRARLLAVLEQLAQHFVSKREIIRMLLVSAIAQQPALLVGRPGTAKTGIALKLCEALGARRHSGESTLRQGNSFEYLFHPFTEPEEVLGAVNIAGLQASPPHFERNRKGSIIDAEVLVLDELFRANSAILNAILSIVNERHVYEGGIAHPAKARVIVGATNNVPMGAQLEILEAIYERFAIRLESTSVDDGHHARTEKPGPGPWRHSEERDELLRRGWAQEVRQLRGGYDVHQTRMEPIACLNDLLLMNRAVAEAYGGPTSPQAPRTEATRVAYHRIVKNAREEGVARLDDRKFIRFYGLMRAHALFDPDGARDIKPMDLTVLRHTWTSPERKQGLCEIVDTEILRASE